jgi:hypothetical protein
MTFQVLRSPRPNAKQSTFSKGPPRTSVPVARRERVSGSEHRHRVAVVGQGSLSRASRVFGTASEVTRQVIGQKTESPTHSSTTENHESLRARRDFAEYGG